MTEAGATGGATIAPMPPWLAPICETLRGTASRGRLPHAVLIEGGPARGGDWLAHWLAALTHCTQPGAPCLQCGDCRRVFAGQQPDVQRISPEEDSREIRIYQIRDAAAELALTRHGAGRKVAILTPADRLNRHAANALLKTLEEPSGSSLLILVASYPSRLPATIRSRCVRLRVPRPSLDVALTWLDAQRAGVDWRATLALCGGEPFAALDSDPQLIAAVMRATQEALGGEAGTRLDPIALADAWSRQHYELRLAAIENWITDRLRESAGVRRESTEMRPATHLPGGDARLNIRQLFAALDAVREARVLAESPVNKTLVLERLLWMLASARAAKRAAS
jgi:DNA polymerase-3 subunit delta'